MIDRDLDNMLAANRSYANLETQHAIFTRLRHEDPLHWCEPDGYRPFWVVTKHADVLDVERQNELFLSQPRSKLFTIEFEQQIRTAMQGRTHLVRGLPQMDGHDHRVYRALGQAWFQPKHVKTLEGRIAALARRSVDELLARGPKLDFYRDIAVWYPLRVVMMILGLPEADEERLLRITQAYFGGSDPEVQKGSDLIKATQDYVAYFDGVTESRRRHPTDDLSTLIATAQIDGQPIDHYHASSYYVQVISAGHDTTSASTAGGLLALIENPGEWRKLKANPALLNAAVDEMIRWVSPVKHFFRTAATDTTLRGTPIATGQHLMLSYPSANRDEDVFQDPFAFRVDRSPNKHVGFGYGPHICLGMFLAKLEMQILFRELLERVDHFALDGPPAWVETSFVGGLKRLPVRVTAVA
jgi:cytochrome P450